MTERNIDELYREYDLKMGEMYNDCLIYADDDIFGVYRAHRKVMLLDRDGVKGEERDKAVLAFVAAVDALFPKKDAPQRIYLWLDLPYRCTFHHCIRMKVTVNSSQPIF